MRAPLFGSICISLYIYIPSFKTARSLERYANVNPATLRARDGETCDGDRLLFPLGKQLTEVFDAFTEEDVHVIAKVRHMDYQ